MVRDFVLSGQWRNMFAPAYRRVRQTIPEEEGEDRGEEADFIVFRMGEREKTFFAKLGMAGKSNKPVKMCDVAEKLVKAKLSGEGIDDPVERAFYEKYKHLKLEKEQAQKGANAQPGDGQQAQNGAPALPMGVFGCLPVGLLKNNNANDNTTKSNNESVPNGSIVNGNVVPGIVLNGISKKTPPSENHVDFASRDFLVSSNSRRSAASLRMKPPRLSRTDTNDDFDYDQDEDVSLKELKTFRTPRRKITKTVDLYNLACVMCGVVPMRHYIKQCSKRNVDLTCTSLAAATVKPIAISLVRDRKVVNLNLSDNEIGDLGVIYIAEMMTRNNHITELNLSGTYPGKDGLSVLSESLGSNTCLQILRLESNKIEHTETHTITEIIQNVRSLKELYLGHNAIGYEGCCLLAKTLADNTTLRVLDMQWNHIRRESAAELCKALGVNSGLQTLNVSWNGLGKEGCIALAKSLPQNSTLRTLNMTSNRIDMVSLRFLLHGLVRNSNLKMLDIGRNPITTEGARAVLRAVLSSSVSALERLGLDDISVDESCITSMKELKEKKGVYVTHGELLSAGNMVEEKKHDPHDLNRFDPVLVLVEYMRIDNLRLIDFFQYFDTSSREKLSKSDFRDGVANLSIPLTEHHLDIIMEKVDLKQDGFVDLEEFMTVHREVSRQVTTRTTKARQKQREDEGLVSLRKILRDIVEKRNKANKEKAKMRSLSRQWSKAITKVIGERRFSETVPLQRMPTLHQRRASVQVVTSASAASSPERHLE